MKDIYYSIPVKDISVLYRSYENIYNLFCSIINNIKKKIYENYGEIISKTRDKNMKLEELI